MSEHKKPVALLLRHGDTEANEANVYRSRLDPPLNEKGHKQAEKAAKYIKAHYHVVRVVSSPMLRACQTADAVAEALGLETIQDRAIISWNLGFLSGRDKKTYEPILGFFIESPKEVIPEGESLDQVIDRIQEYFEVELKKPKKDGITVYATHTSDIITLDNLLKGTSESKPEMGESTVEPGGILAVYETKDGFEMESVLGKENENTYGS